MEVKGQETFSQFRDKKVFTPSHWWRKLHSLLKLTDELKQKIQKVFSYKNEPHVGHIVPERTRVLSLRLKKD